MSGKVARPTMPELREANPNNLCRLDMQNNLLECKESLSNVWQQYLIIAAEGFAEEDNQVDGVHERLSYFWRELETMDLNVWWQSVSTDPALHSFKDRVLEFYACSALQTGRRDLLCLMLENGFDPNSDCDDNDPVIFLAIAPIAKVGFSTVWMLKDLILAGADINVRWYGQTPIFSAIMENALAHLVVLLEAGADPWYIHHEMGMNAYEFCVRDRKFDALNILREFS
jgi:hypothetical protein